MAAAVHFPAPGFGRVVRGEARRYWQALPGLKGTSKLGRHQCPGV